MTVEVVPDPTTLALELSVTVGCRDWDCYWRTSAGYLVTCHKHHPTAMDGVHCMARHDAIEAGWTFHGLHPSPRVLRTLLDGEG